MSSEMRELVAKWRAVATEFAKRYGAADDMGIGIRSCASDLEALLARTEAGADEDSLFTPSEHLAACRESWQQVCDALGANGQHMDPPDVLNSIAKLTHPQDASAVAELADAAKWFATTYSGKRATRLANAIAALQQKGSGNG